MKTAILIRKNGGFSIVGALIGAAAALAIGLAISQLIQTQADMVSYMEDRLAVVGFRGELDMNLDNTAACVSTLNNATFRDVAGNRNPVPLQQIVNSRNTKVFQVGERYEKVLVQNMTAQAVNSIAASGSGEVEFTISLQRTRGSISKNFAPVRVRKVVTLGPASTVISCEDVDPSGVTPPPGTIAGRIDNISGGCSGEPTDVTGSGLAANEAARPGIISIATAAKANWQQYCQNQTFPLAQSAYRIAANNKTVSELIATTVSGGGGLTTSIESIPEGTVFNVSRLSGAQNENTTGSQIRGPYANLYQCMNDGVIPAGSRYSVRLSSGGGSGSGGEGSGTSVDTSSGVCVNGSWYTSD